MGRGFPEKVKEDDIYLKYGLLKNFDFFLDRQTDIVVHREVTLPKYISRHAGGS